MILLALGILVMGDRIEATLDELIAEPFEVLEENELTEVELHEEIEAATKMSVEVMASPVAIGEAGAGVGDPGEPTIDPKIVEQSTTDITVAVGPPQHFTPAGEYLVQDVPEGARGDERMIVENVDQALSQITAELLQMLENGNVVVVWAFDMSNSMEDERQEIHDRIDRVYTELGITGRARNGRLTTAVTSYGSNFFIHTRNGPTSNLEHIRAAIKAVQNDESGKEMMCQAVGAAINQHREYAKKQKRQMALVLLTDESGEPENNQMYLEQAITEAKSANCRIYTMGREAVFGYPHARMRWKHPQTGRTHWLLVDRGPETAFAEQLQTNGFRRRHDAFSSGFGPFAQTRMANETGGIFFMLPTEEEAIVAGEKRRYELEAMRSYKPDLRSQLEQFEERDTHPMRTFLWQVVTDLNPLESPQKARELEMRIHYSLNPTVFVRQAREEQTKARQYLNYLAQAEKILLDNKRLREQEVSPRWQGNYDLMLAQLVTFQVRIYEYGVYLDYFMKNPKTAPQTRGAAILNNWAITTRKITFAEKQELAKDYPDREKVLEYIQRGKQLFADVMKNHTGTPWAARAQYELNRGFGVELVADYDTVDRKLPSGIKLMPVPKY